MLTTQSLIRKKNEQLKLKKKEEEDSLPISKHFLHH